MNETWNIYQAFEGGVLQTKIKSLWPSCQRSRSFHLKITQVLSRPYLIYHFMYNHHTLYASTTWDGGVLHTITRSLWFHISCITIIPCMQVRLGMVVCCIPLLGHC